MAAPVSLRLNDAPRYEEFYGFAHPPFAAAPGGPNGFVPVPPHAAVLQWLLDAIGRRERVAALTGPTGAGKTTLCRAVVSRVDPAVLVSLVTGPPGSIEDLLRTVLQDFGLISTEGTRTGRAASATREELAGALDGFLRSLEPIGGRCLILVDEAHRLPPGVLQGLGALAGSDAAPARLQLVLAGTPDLLTLLQAEELRPLDERISTRLALDALAPGDVATYVSTRLSNAGGSGAPTFERGAIEAVHRHTGGVPLAVHEICNRALALAAQLEIRAIGAEVVEEAARGTALPDGSSTAGRRAAVPRWTIALAVVLLLGLIAVWFSGTVSALFP